MNQVINARELRQSLGDILHRVEQGERFTVLYRSRLVGQIVPCTDSDSAPLDGLSQGDSAEAKDLLERLRQRAAQRGVPVADEIRQILQQAVAAPENLGDLACVFSARPMATMNSFFQSAKPQSRCKRPSLHGSDPECEGLCRLRH